MTVPTPSPKSLWTDADRAQWEEEDEDRAQYDDEQLRREEDEAGG